MPTRSFSDLTRDVLTVAARVSGDPCEIHYQLLGGDYLRATVESTDASGGEYLRVAHGETPEECLSGLLGVMAADEVDGDEELTSADLIRGGGVWA